MQCHSSRKLNKPDCILLSGTIAFVYFVCCIILYLLLLFYGLFIYSIIYE